MAYEQKYLKYKQKYLELKNGNFELTGGRLIDLVNPEYTSKIKNECETANKISKNFDLCNTINEKLGTSANSFVIILWLLTNDFSTPDDSMIVENIMLNHTAKNTNIYLLTNISKVTTTRLNKDKYHYIQCNKDKFNSTLDEIIKSIIKTTEISKPNEVSPGYINFKTNVTFYNIAHGNLKTYFSDDLFASDIDINKDTSINCELQISKDEYFQRLKPFYESNKEFNIMLVNNNCYSSYVMHGHFKNAISELAKTTDVSKVNLFTFSTRPCIKYLWYLRFILFFVTKEFIINFNNSKEKLAKYKIFRELNDKILLKLSNTEFKDQVEQIFYEPISEITTNLFNLFELFYPSDNNVLFNSLENIINNMMDKNYIPLNLDSIDLKTFDFSNKKNNINSINQFIEQKSAFTYNTYLKLNIESKGMFTTTRFPININSTIMEINDSLRRNKDFIEFFIDDLHNVNSNIKDFFNNKRGLKKLIMASFINQEDILFIPIEPSIPKRVVMENIKLKDLI